MSWEIRGRCLDCGAAYKVRIADPTKAAMKTQVSNRDIWSMTHYEVTRHHRFEFEETTVRELSVARIHNPDQGRITDDDNYSTERVGPSE